jgi:hypothetical protein
MRGYFYDRVNADLPVPGLFLVHGATPVGQVIEADLARQRRVRVAGKIEFVPSVNRSRQAE